MLPLVQGLFHSPFILPILATHLDQVSQGLNVPALYDPKDPIRPTSYERPIGAIALITTAVSCMYLARRSILMRQV